MTSAFVSEAMTWAIGLPGGGGGGRRRADGGGAVKFFWPFKAAIRSERELNLGSSTSAMFEATD